MEIKMDKTLIVIDNFYEDPYAIREFALKQEFNTSGNYPGVRTKSLISDEARDKISEITQNMWGGTTEFPTHEGSYQGAFQYCCSWEKSWVHYDNWNSFATVVYMTPDAPLQCGTALYRHIKTGVYRKPENEDLCKRLLSDGRDYTKWEKLGQVGNVFNRAVIYPGDYWHASVEYFGFEKESARMIQTFFYNISSNVGFTPTSQGGS